MITALIFLHNGTRSGALMTINEKDIFLTKSFSVEPVENLGQTFETLHKDNYTIFKSVFVNDYSGLKPLMEKYL